ncbi:MAG: hypothetical protein ACK4WH_00835 [Phycisphaerales bacterium]
MSKSSTKSQPKHRGSGSAGEQQAWPASVCSALRKVRVNRVNAKSQLTDLIALRKELEERIDALGPTKTADRLDADHELVQCLRDIEYQRARCKQLADRLEKIIEDADQGKFEFAGEIDTDFTREELFAEVKKARKVVPCVGGTYSFKAGDGEFAGEVIGGGKEYCRVEIHSVRSGEGSRGEVIEIEWPKYAIDEIDVPKDAIRVDQGVANTAVAVQAPSPIGAPEPSYDGWRLVLRDDGRDVGVLSRHQVPDRAVAILRKAGVTTIGACARPLPGATPGFFGAFKWIKGITPGDEVLIETALKRLAESTTGKDH